MTLRWKDSNFLTLLALVLGVSCGLLIHRSGATSWTSLVELAAAVGTLVVNAVRLTIIPLIFAMLVVATSARGSAGARILGLSTVTFATLLVLGATYSMTVTSALIRGFHPPSTTLATSSRTGSSEAPDETKEQKPPDRSGWKAIGELLPSNLLRAATNDEFLPIVLFAIVLGLATARLNSELSSPLIQFFEVGAQVLRILTGWVLKFLPMGVFGIALSTTAVSGADTLGVIGYWIGLVCLVLSLFILLLYVVARVAGGVPLRDFAKSVFEAQTVAFATRSSIAALPALFRGAETHLPDTRHVAPIVLGLSAGGFKLNRAVSSICRLIFLAHMYSISLSVETVAVFTVTSLLTNLATPGVPSQGSGPVLPLYLAAGLPIEGVILLGSVDLIPDVFMTLLNVTGDMTAVTIVARFYGKPEAVLN